MKIDEVRAALERGTMQDRIKPLGPPLYLSDPRIMASDIVRIIKEALARGERIEVIAHQTTWTWAKPRMRLVLDEFHPHAFEKCDRPANDSLGERVWQFTGHTVPTDDVEVNGDGEVVITWDGVGVHQCIQRILKEVNALKRVRVVFSNVKDLPFRIREALIEEIKHTIYDDPDWVFSVSDNAFSRNHELLMFRKNP